MLFRFCCAVCEYDDDEAGHRLPAGEHLCPLCAEDNGRDVILTLLSDNTDKEQANADHG